LIIGKTLCDSIFLDHHKPTQIFTQSEQTNMKDFTDFTRGGI